MLLLYVQHLYDGVGMHQLQVIKVLPEKKLTPKELEAKEKERQEELQRMDTDARLQVCSTLPTGALHCLAKCQHMPGW